MFVSGSGSSAAASSYTIANSVRFRAGGPAYLSRTPGVAGNRTTWTWSGWVKRSTFGTSIWPLFLQTGSRGSTAFSSYTMLYITADVISLNQNNSGGTGAATITTFSILRDPAAWYHIIAVWDTNNATSTDRMRLYLNGVRCTVNMSVTPTSGLQSYINQAALHEIGNYQSSTTNPIDGYLAEVNFIDGQALDATYFGQFDTNGIWTPKAYTGAYGTNGFYLQFNDGSSAANLCLDRSGNGNNWTPTNISVTAGVNYDWMSDTPTNNYPVLNSLDWAVTKPTIANGSLTFTTNTTSPYNSNPSATFNIPISGKWYFEATVTAFNIGSTGYSVVGLWLKTSGATRYVMWTYQSPFYQMNGDSGLSTVSTISGGGVIMVAVDNSSGKAWFGYNGTWYLSGDPATGVAMSNPIAFTAGTDNITVLLEGRTGTGVNTTDVNFGQRPFTYTPPTGFQAICSANTPAVSLTQPSNYFNVVTQLGSAVSTGAALLSQFTGFTADFAWGKDRTAANSHQLVDTVRGNTVRLQSQATAIEDSYAAPTSGDSCVAWGWKAGGAAVSNTAGSVTSSVSVSSASGFSIVTFTDPNGGVAYTVGHGLPAAPKMLMVKNRTGATADWYVFHSSIGATGAVFLDLTNITNTSSTFWNNTAPTSSVFTVGSALATGGKNYVAYCFSEVPNFSKFGSYTGNSNADGPFIYCGFKPRFLLTKNTGTTGNWRILDTARDTYNVSQYALFPNTTGQELSGTTYYIDILSNGFKIRTTSADVNSTTIIYAAFAESPFAGSNVAPATAR